MVPLKLNLLLVSHWDGSRLFLTATCGVLFRSKELRHLPLTPLSLEWFHWTGASVFWLCPSQPEAINHLKWTALTGSWLHHSFYFLLFFIRPYNLTHCFPQNPHQHRTRWWGFSPSYVLLEHSEFNTPPKLHPFGELALKLVIIVGEMCTYRG